MLGAFSYLPNQRSICSEFTYIHYFYKLIGLNHIISLTIWEFCSFFKCSVNIRSLFIFGFWAQNLEAPCFVPTFMSFLRPEVSQTRPCFFCLKLAEVRIRKGTESGLLKVPNVRSSKSGAKDFPLCKWGTNSGRKVAFSGNGRSLESIPGKKLTVPPSHNPPKCKS